VDVDVDVDVDVGVASQSSRRLETKVKMSACTWCSKGMYCPLGAAHTDKNLKCQRGSYCPTPTEQIKCPRNSICSLTTHRACTLGSWCPRNATREFPCPHSFFCPEPADKIECLEGNFCRGANTEPQACPFYATSCPPGSNIPKGGKNIFFGVLVALFLVFETFHRYSINRKKRLQKLKEKEAQTVFHSKALKKRGLQHANSEKIKFSHLKPDATPISFEFDNLSLRLNNGKRIISDVTGKVESGKMTAIMGPSGCGKTTMLNVLRNKASYGEIGGSLKVNKTYTSIAPFRRIVGFVPQEDILHNELTVQDEIMFASLLKNSMFSTISARKKQVEEIIR